MPHLFSSSVLSLFAPLSSVRDFYADYTHKIYNPQSVKIILEYFVENVKYF